MTEFTIEFEFNDQKHSATIWKFVTLDNRRVQFHALNIEPLPEGVREILVYIANDGNTGFEFISTPGSFDFMAYVLEVLKVYCAKNNIALFVADPRII